MKINEQVKVKYWPNLKNMVDFCSNKTSQFSSINISGSRNHSSNTNSSISNSLKIIFKKQVNHDFYMDIKRNMS